MNARTVLLGILGWGLLAIFPAWLLLFIFDPMDARHFLLDAEYAETVVPIARFVGTIVSISLTGLYIVGYRIKQHDAALGGSEGESRLHPTRQEMFEYALVLFFTLLMGYGIFYDSTKTVIALTMHYRAKRHEFSAPFTIKNVVRQKFCNGVEASNSEFYDDKICGVTWEGEWSLYDGQDVILSGKRSKYGFMVEHYKLPDPDPKARSSASAQPPARLPEVQGVF